MANSDPVYTPEFRVSYPKVFTAEFNKLSKKEEYSLTALFPKNADLTPLKNAAKAALAEEFGDKMNNPEFVKKLKNPFRDQAEKIRDDGSMPLGMEKGAIFMTLKSSIKKKPVVVNQQVKPILIESEFYAGCYAVAVVTANAFNIENGVSMGVSFWIQAIQKVREGEPLSGGSSIDVNKAFAPIAGTESNAASSLL